MLSTSRACLGLVRPAFQGLVRRQVARSLTTVTTTHDREQEILIAQRKNRPSSPHLTIYQPQLTWYLSSVHRITGCVMAGAFYVLTCGYAASSIFGFHLDSTMIQEAFYNMSTPAQYAAKGAMVLPFFFHFGNGIRHLIWDAGKELTLKGVYRTGYTVLGFTAVMSIFYTFF